ncbi:hypothetical protein V5O48_003387 [Marasmius crinis-equi]|uniref:Uncharacterized protein n=1 Tax=Marasmius crinis-equi TaxID=585013 RepID=A0ABR3FT03_9AGAR
MAVPTNFTTLDFTGKYVMNKSLSDPHDDILAAQGIGWITRKAIGIATITVYVKHYKDEQGVEHIDIEEKLTGGIQGTPEKRTLYWKERQTSDQIFGELMEKSRRVTDLSIVEPDDEWFKGNWTADSLEYGLVQCCDESHTPKSGKTWIGNQLWGIEEVNGERRHSRHVHFTGGNGKVIKARLLYDYIGPLDS